MENWILSIPAPSALTHTIYDNFKEEFIESWTDTNKPYHAAAELNKLWMNYDNVDTYITQFAELAHKALYHKEDPAVLEKFKARLPLELEKCMHHDDPHNWDAWMRSARMCQAILTSLQAHQTNKSTQQTPLPMKEYLPTPLQTPLMTPPPVPMKINKVYTITCMTKTQNTGRHQMVMRPLSPLQRPGTHSTLLSQESH